MFYKNFFKGRIRLRYFVLGLITVAILDYFGVFTHLFELDFETKFRYPFEGNIEPYVKLLKQGLKPDVDPINIYNQSFISKCNHKCMVNENLRLIILVKSAVDNFDRRRAIRSTWGFESRFSDVPTRTVFLVGMSSDTDSLITLLQEKEVFNDIVHIDFIDNYFNNTIKTMNGLRWAQTYCPNAKYYLFADDDMYISIKNVFRFIRHPVMYPQYLNNNDKHINPYSLELPNSVNFYAGSVFISSPLRLKPSKWYISLAEYPFDQWPPYISAGAYILSKEALLKLYFTSFYTKHFRFDDIYLAIVAYKAGIEVFNSKEFYYYRKPYTVDNYKYVIASHGFDDPAELVKVWTEQKSAGNA